MEKKTLKPMLSNKSITNRNIIRVKNEIILYNDNALAEILNNFFSNFTKSLGIPKNVYSDFFISEMDDPTLRGRVKYRKIF